MDIHEKQSVCLNYQIKLSPMEEYAGIVFSPPAVMYCYDTCQFDDYKLYVAERFSEEEKMRRKREHFPKDCKNACVIGRTMARRATGQNPTASESLGRI